MGYILSSIPLLPLVTMVQNAESSVGYGGKCSTLTPEGHDSGHQMSHKPFSVLLKISGLLRKSKTM